MRNMHDWVERRKKMIASFEKCDQPELRNMIVKGFCERNIW